MADWTIDELRGKIIIGIGKGGVACRLVTRAMKESYGFEGALEQRKPQRQSHIALKHGFLNRLYHTEEKKNRRGKGDNISMQKCHELC